MFYKDTLTAMLGVMYVCLGSAVLRWAAATTHRFVTGLVLISALGTAVLLCVFGIVAAPGYRARHVRRRKRKKRLPVGSTRTSATKMPATAATEAGG